MKKKLLFFALALTASQSFGQTTLFEDNFDQTPPGTVAASTQYGKQFTAGNSNTVSDLKYTYVGSTNQPSGWYQVSANGYSGLNNISSSSGASFTSNLSVQGSSGVGYRGATTVAVSYAQFPLLNPKLNLNSGVITWSFAMRINKSSVLGTLNGAFNDNNDNTNQGSSFFSGGMILATNATATGSIASTSAKGYAVIMHANALGTKNQITFGKFTNGLKTDTNGGAGTSTNPSTFTPLLTVDNIGTGASTPADRNTSSVIVSYNPATGAWTMSVRNETDTTSLQDPLTAYTASGAAAPTPFVVSTPASIVDNDHTAQTNTNMMMYFNIGGTQGMYVDNLTIKTSATLGVAKNEIEGLNIYPNPVKNGVLFVNTNSDDVKEVAIYNLLGSKVATKQVNAGTVDVSGIAKGLYVVKVTEAGKTSVRKIVIQ